MPGNAKICDVTHQESHEYGNFDCIYSESDWGMCIRGISMYGDSVCIVILCKNESYEPWPQSMGFPPVGPMNC